jgi:hypothetical protein
MKTQTVLGRIDCKGCGTPNGMRITHDKNMEPFGFCDAECGLQMRIGGNKRRVELFIKNNPWAAAPGAKNPGEAAPGQTPDKPAAARPAAKASKQKPVLPAEPVQIVEPSTPPPAAPVEVKKRSSFEDALALLGGVK